MGLMMMDKYEKLIYEMLDVMYQCSEPSISWWEIEDTYSKTDVAFYENYYLDYDDANMILEEYKKQFPKHMRFSVSMEFLNYAPTSVRK